MIIVSFCLTKVEAFIINESLVIQKIYDKNYYNSKYQNYFDFSDLILNDDGTQLYSKFWLYSDNGFFEDFNIYSPPSADVVVGEDSKRVAILFKRSDNPNCFFSLTQFKIFK